MGRTWIDHIQSDFADLEAKSKELEAQIERWQDEFSKLVDIRDALVVKNAQLEAINKQQKIELDWLRYRNG